jgi:hypothetical protein
MNVEIILPKMVMLGQKRIATICIRTKETFGQGGMLPHRPTNLQQVESEKGVCRYRQRTSDHPTLESELPVDHKRFVPIWRAWLSAIPGETSVLLSH